MPIQPILVGLQGLFLLSPLHGNGLGPAEETRSAASGSQDWLELDREIAGLGALSAQGGAAVELHGRLRTSAVTADEVFGGATDDVSGFDIREARIELEGTVGDYDFVVSTSSTGGALSLTDAYVATDLTGSVGLAVGRFKQPFLYTGRLETKHLLFLDRTQNGEQTSVRDVGALVRGDFDAFHWILSAQNGVNGPFADSLYLAHARYDVLGNPFDQYEGAFGAEEGIHLGIGGSVAVDGGLENGTKVGGEIELTQGPFYVHADAVAYDEEYDDPNLPLEPDLFLGTPLSDTNPYSVTLAYLLGNEEVELALRYESFDDDEDTSRFMVGVNWYTQGLGHEAKWQLGYTEVSSDLDALEGDRIELGLALAW